MYRLDFKHLFTWTPKAFRKLVDQAPPKDASFVYSGMNRGRIYEGQALMEPKLEVGKWFWSANYADILFRAMIAPPGIEKRRLQHALDECLQRVDQHFGRWEVDALVDGAHARVYDVYAEDRRRAELASALVLEQFMPTARSIRITKVTEWAPF